jgi:23S rRNA pseudouridine2605 synthase
MHPSFKVRKTYEVVSERPLTDAELAGFQKGIPLDDGVAKAHKVQGFA